MSSEQLKDAPQEDLNWAHPANAFLKVLDTGTVQPSGRTKVAIVGFAAGTKDLAPFDDPDFEVWGLNQLYRHIPRADRWFDMHANYLEGCVEGTDHDAWLRRCPIPVYMTDAHTEYPNAIRYPLESMISTWGDYFTSTIAYMVALAISEGFQDIHLYGIDLVVGTEYGFEKPCAEFWLGVATGKGIRVHLPAGSALCKATHRYGYQSEPDYGPFRLVEMDARITHLDGQWQEAHKHLAALDGAYQEMKFLEKVHDLQLQERAEKMDAERKNCVVETAKIEGALQEIKFWHNLYTLRMRGATVQVIRKAT